MYKLIKKDKNTSARRGQIATAHGVLEAPFFMPVGTNATVKSVSFEQLREVEAQIVLSNTYHLFLRPGMDVLNKIGGLHKFMNWDRPTLTDSGGYQVFSLAKFRKLSDEGVKFQSHHDGSYQFFTPEFVVDIQRAFGTDMMMPLDVCAPYPCSREEAEESVRLTTLWARRSKDQFLKTQSNDRKQFLFSIVQGATHKDLREQSAKELVALDSDAYAVGGVSVGEPVKDMFEALEWTMPFLPENKPRYFMGIGLPDQIVKAVGEGVDMFDTCLPTRMGRHGTAFTKTGRVILKNAENEKSQMPIDDQCQCKVCATYSRAYIRHLLRCKETFGMTLVSYHNLYFYINLMKDIRRAIEEDNYQSFQEEFLRKYRSELVEVK